MRFLRFSLIALFIGTLQFSHAQTTEKWTLEKCISYALQNNLQVRQAAVTAKLSGADHLQSKLNFLPTIDANGSYSDNFGNGFNPQTFSFAQGNSQSVQLQLTGSMPIFTGLQQIYNVQKARYDFMASKFDYETAQTNMALNVASAYLQILLNQEIVKVAEKQRELTIAQHDIVQNKIKAGSLPEAAIYDVESQMGRDDVAVVNSKNSVDLAILGLAQLLQLTVQEERTFVIDAPEVKADNMGDIAALASKDIFTYAIQNQPVIKSAEARLQSANATQKISYGGFSPTLSAFGSLSSGYFSQDRQVLRYDTFALGGFSTTFPAEYGKIPLNQELSNNFRQVVGLQLDIPLFSRGTKVINMQKAKLQVQIRQLQLESSKNQLRADIEQAYANAKAAAGSYLANKKSLEASQKAYESTETRYKAGIASNFDLEQSKDNLISAESEIVKAKYTYVFRMKILDFYQGKAITLN
ncbi:MAG: hypothetical protein JWO06_2008 [Bacteroidota bacterium]|nr:hypothetical protein [Bacteroidota bacterium]